MMGSALLRCGAAMFAVFVNTGFGIYLAARLIDGDTGRLDGSSLVILAITLGCNIWCAVAEMLRAARDLAEAQ